MSCRLLGSCDVGSPAGCAPCMGRAKRRANVLAPGGHHVTADASAWRAKIHVFSANSRKASPAVPRTLRRTDPGLRVCSHRHNCRVRWRLLGSPAVSHHEAARASECLRATPAKKVGNDPGGSWLVEPGEFVGVAPTGDVLHEIELVPASEWSMASSLTTALMRRYVDRSLSAAPRAALDCSYPSP